MASEQLTIPEDHLLSVTHIIRLGILRHEEVNELDIPKEVIAQLERWCREMEDYIREKQEPMTTTNPYRCFMCQGPVPEEYIALLPQSTPPFCWGCQYRIIGNLAMMCKRMKRAMNTHDVAPNLQARAVGLLGKYGLMGSVLRGEESVVSLDSE